MKEDSIFLQHVIESINNIEKFSKGISRKEFIHNREKQSAVIRELEIIGEASKNISEKLKRAYKNIEWKPVSGLRDKLTHHYFGIDLDNVWNVIKADLPKLKKEISKIKT